MRRIAFLALVLGLLVALGVVLGVGGREGKKGGEQRLSYRFVPAIRNLDEPVHVTAPRSEPNNLYVVEKGGKIRVRVRGRLRARPFLDISRLVSNGSEQGLLSLAFHPNYGRGNNRRFFVYYTDRGEDERIIEYRSRGLSRSPVRVRQLLYMQDPYSNHNGGQLAFGPDGYLYAANGDGGSGGDPENRAQNMRVLFGKIFRFNVGVPRPRASIVGLGLRNPWRFSFDRQTGDLYIGDVGQNAWEELDFTPRRSPGLENYGWRVYEGRERYTNETPNSAGRLVFPIAVLPNGPNCSIIAGFVYRGTAVPAARGRFFFGDNCVSQIRSIAAPGGTAVRNEPFNIGSLSSFGEDARGELYAASLNGVVYRLVR
ncbi:MAG TPA: PQQ-dependent sugar dehydrogenase [Gaiellaceae bacterium]|jgi:glucose/arabinose dehydrogenase|nr:PQQ-dependent sugar dehydrogenase [Gaiellaceae bacterium]